MMKYNNIVDNLLNPYRKITTQKYLDDLFRNFSLIEIEHDRFEYDGNYDEITKSKTIFQHDEDTQQTTTYVLTFDEHVENLFLSENQKSKTTIELFYKSLSNNDIELANQFYNYLQKSIKEMLNTTNIDVLEKFPFIKDCFDGIKKRAKFLHQKTYGSLKIDSSQNSLYIHSRYLSKVDTINNILDSDAFKKFYIELGGFQKSGGYINCMRIDRFKKIFKNEVILYPIVWNKQISGLTLLIEKLKSANVISSDGFSTNNQGLWQTVAKCFIDKNGKKISLAQFNTGNSNDNTLIQEIDKFIKNLNKEFQAE